MNLNRSLLTIVFAAICAVMPGEAAMITVSSPSAVTEGAPVDLDVSIELAGAETLYAYQFNLVFPLFLQADSVTALGYFAANGVGASSIIDNASGIITVFDFLSGLDSLTASDTVVRVTFATVAPGSGQVTVDPDSVILLDGGFSDVPVTGLNAGAVEVTSAGAAAVPEPSSIATVMAGLGLLLARYRSSFSRKRRANDQ